MPRISILTASILAPVALGGVLLTTTANAETTGGQASEIWFVQPEDKEYFPDVPATIDVVLDTAQVEAGTSVKLWIDDVLHDVPSCEFNPECVYPGIVLEEGEHILRAHKITDIGIAADSVRVYVGVEPPVEEDESAGSDGSGGVETDGLDMLTTGGTDGDEGDDGGPDKGGCVCSGGEPSGAPLSMLLGLLVLARRRR